MSRVVAQFDPTAGSGAFQAGAVNRCSALLVMNESQNFLQLDFGGAGSRMIVQPWFNLVIRLPNPVQTVNWTVAASLQSGGSPVSVVYVIGFEPSESVSDTLTGPLFRQSNVGNAAAVTSATASIQNDGNAAGTVIVEATPSGAAGSQAKLTNDGAFLCGGGLFSIANTGVVTAIPNGAVPAAGVATGYPAADLAAGTLPAGVAVPVANVASGYPAADLGAGALPSGVTLSLSQLTNGTGNPVNGSLSSGSIQTRWKSFGGAILVSGRDIIAGTGSGTFSHAAGVTPYIANLICHTVNSTQTMGYDSETSSSIHVNTGGGLAWRGDVNG